MARTDPRRALIEALTYPRMLMLSDLEIDRCPMHGFFNLHDQGCRICHKSEECIWLNVNDDFIILAQRDLCSLLEALDYTIDYVETHVICNEHNLRRCACESCRWIRDTRHLVRKHRRTN